MCCAPLPVQVQALRSIEKHLGLEKLYVLGTNCVDNGRRGTLEVCRAISSLELLLRWAGFISSLSLSLF